MNTRLHITLDIKVVVKTVKVIIPGYTMQV